MIYMNFHSYKTNRTKGRKLNKAEQKQIVQAKLEKERSINKTTTEIQKYVLQKQNQKKEEIINKNKQDRLNHDKRTVELFKKKQKNIIRLFNKILKFKKIFKNKINLMLKMKSKIEY